MSYEWQFSTPEAEGMSSTILQQVDDYIKQKRYRLINSILILKNDKIVFEKYYNKYNEQSRNRIRSVWKSIISIAVGICLDKGYIKSLDEPIGTYIDEFASNRHPYHKLITIRHLLTMSSGIYWNGGIHYHCPMLAQMLRSKEWVNHISDIAMSNVPGTQFQYKEWDIILLSALVGRAFGGTAYEIVNQYLYRPLDIMSEEWLQGSCGISYNAILDKEHADLSARDLAKIGMLFLHNGMWNGNRIVSSDFVRDAITPSFDTVSIDATTSGYGLLWWLLPGGYGARGSGGQEINVIPESNYVSIIQATPTASAKGYGDIHMNILSRAIV
ncbi:serine hydrolase [Paenibacillus sp. GSMTC-2017]|uniref:serine hydrolase domain-containing protein n=1 Tax=Paenibacillus sp. GSMTC-2017 TaxID=2794350 RepID=UPI0018D65AA9|nr:serine hydrolase [Paenibacillus sp. GSMTC-2017]MBH5319047.1 serine hydrolase [Paenibacillus sp. GSMTC-2017]